MNKMPRPQYRYNRPNDLYPLAPPGGYAPNMSNLSPYGPPPRQFHQMAGMMPVASGFLPHCGDVNQYNANRFQSAAVDQLPGAFYTSSYYKSNQQNLRPRGVGSGGYRNDYRDKNREISPAGNGKGRSQSPGSTGGARAGSSDAPSSSASYQGPPVLSRTNLYIRGLPPDATDQHLLNLCKEFGKIISTKAIIDQQMQSCKGYGFVDFESSEAAEAAVITLQERGIQVQMAKQQQERDVTNLYVANLPVHLSESDLQSMFEPFGPVVSTRILRDHLGVSRGVGFARMEARDACDAIINAFNGKLLPHCNLSEPLTVKFADGGGKKRSPHSNSSEGASNRQWINRTPDSVCSAGAAASSVSGHSNMPQVLSIYEPQHQLQQQQQQIQQQQQLHQQQVMSAATATVYTQNGVALQAAMLSPVGGPQGYTTSPVLTSYLASPPALTGPPAGTWMTIPQPYSPLTGPPHAAFIPAGATMIQQPMGTAGTSTYILHPVGSALPAGLISGAGAAAPIYHPQPVLVDPSSLLPQYTIMANHGMTARQAQPTFTGLTNHHMTLHQIPLSATGLTNHQLAAANQGMQLSAQMSQLHIATPTAAEPAGSADEHSSHNAPTAASAV